MAMHWKQLEWNYIKFKSRIHACQAKHKKTSENSQISKANFELSIRISQLQVHASLLDTALL